jgi:2-methylisocitrate lyase-like PEP mutase family enzyme
VTASVSRPINVVIGMLNPGISAQDLAQAGVKRISIGGALCRLALAHLLKGAREMKEHGTFNWMAEMVPTAELRKLFS